MRPAAHEPNVFELKAPFRDPVRQRLFGMMRRSLERFFLLDRLNRVYQLSAMEERRGGDFLEGTMRVMDVSFEVAPADLARVPREGPVVVVANHPFGGIEGVVLVAMLRKARPDVKVMANYLLGRMPEMRPYGIFVDPFGTAQAPSKNIAPMKESMRWIRDGHMLAVFPSGEVSHFHPRRGTVTDPRWSETIAGIIRRTGASVLPVFVEGRNSALFQVLGLVHPKLRTAMLPRELLNKQGSRLRFRVGTPVAPARLAKFDSDRAMMDYLRLRTYVLMGREATGSPPPRRRAPWAPPRARAMQPVAEPLYPELLAQDVLLLPPECGLIETEEFAVYAATAPQIPRLLHEIGRLREVTFRAEGEGTGRSLDLDRFDQSYVHLVLWSRAKQELVGAYRMGRTDEILARQGLRGLYTSTLFRYRAGMLRTLGPALELGRSFVRPEYQRHYSALLLLWKGIGRYVTRNPKYRGLFGPVSINNEYNTVSRQMLEAFLRANNFDARWARCVRPRNRPARKARRHWDPDVFRHAVTDPDEMSTLIAEIEKDGKGVPVLLKQYLKLGGRLLGFNVDPEFSDVLDGLIWVDLLELEPRILTRFLGREESRDFLRSHGREPAP